MQSAAGGVKIEDHKFTGVLNEGSNGNFLICTTRTYTYSRKRGTPRFLCCKSKQYVYNILTLITAVLPTLAVKPNYSHGRWTENWLQYEKFRSWKHKLIFRSY